MPNATRDSGGAVTPPKGWNQVLESQRITEYYLDQGRQQRHRLFDIMDQLKQRLLFRRG